MDHLRDSKGKAKKQTTWHSKRRTTSRIDARSSSQSSDDIANLHSINLIAAKWNTNIDPIHSIHGPPDQIQISPLRSIHTLQLPFNPNSNGISSTELHVTGLCMHCRSGHPNSLSRFSAFNSFDRVLFASGHNHKGFAQKWRRQRKENCSGSGESAVPDT